MTEQNAPHFGGVVMNLGKNHKHRLDTRMNGYMEPEIYCKKRRCFYREVDPGGIEVMAQKLIGESDESS